MLMKRAFKNKNVTREKRIRLLADRKIRKTF